MGGAVLVFFGRPGGSASIRISCSTARASTFFCSRSRDGETGQGLTPAASAIGMLAWAGPVPRQTRHQSPSRYLLRRPEIYQVQTRASAAEGSLPLNGSMLLNSPSGDLFG